MAKALTLDSKKVVYMTLFKEGNRVLKNLNPCQIVDGKCQGGYKDDEGLCCDTCKHLGPKGCTVESLECKLWLCMHIKHTPRGAQAAVALDSLREVAYQLGVPLRMRASMEEAFPTNP